MKTLLKGGKVYVDGEIKKADVLIDGERVFEIESEIPLETGLAVIHCDGCFIMPGLIDVHVHFRQPGFEYKETIGTGSASAAAGGYTTVCTMPNLDPAPWNLENLDKQLIVIDAVGGIKVVPYGRITKPSEDGKGNVVADLEAMAPYVVAFSDDGAGVQDDVLMEEAMIRAKELGKIIVAHCEDTNYAPEDSRSEWKQVERDIELVRKTGCGYHVCHVSTKESVDLIRKAKAEGLDVTCETAPHYLIFTREEAREILEGIGESLDSSVDGKEVKLEGGRFKMNPPLRSAEDREALIEGIKDGTIDMIATDHAPHSEEEKAKGFAGSMNGILGLETAFPVLYTKMVQDGIISLEKLIDLMSGNPARRFGLAGGKLEKDGPADLAVVKLDEEFLIDPENFRSKGRSTPFEGMKVKGMVLGVLTGGRPTE